MSIDTTVAQSIDYELSSVISDVEQAGLGCELGSILGSDDGQEDAFSDNESVNGENMGVAGPSSACEHFGSDVDMDEPVSEASLVAESDPSVQLPSDENETSSVPSEVAALNGSELDEHVPIPGDADVIMYAIGKRNYDEFDGTPQQRNVRMRLEFDQVYFASSLPYGSSSVNYPPPSSESESMDVDDMCTGTPFTVSPPALSPSIPSSDIESMDIDQDEHMPEIQPVFVQAEEQPAHIIEHDVVEADEYEPQSRIYTTEDLFGEATDDDDDEDADEVEAENSVPVGPPSVIELSDSETEEEEIFYDDGDGTAW
jgi:hypothetical protein